MKIGFVSFAHLVDWTGITRLIDQLAAKMAARGHEVVIIAQEGIASQTVRKSAHSITNGRAWKPDPTTTCFNAAYDGRVGLPRPTVFVNFRTVWPAILT